LRRSAGKLVLVLDLDHTLLHSAMYAELEQAVGETLEARAATEAAAPLARRSLFRVDSHQVYPTPNFTRFHTLLSFHPSSFLSFSDVH
jgi:hypothetical protein